MGPGMDGWGGDGPHRIHMLVQQIKRFLSLPRELTGAHETLVGDLVAKSDTIPAALRHGTRAQARTHKHARTPGGHAEGGGGLLRGDLERLNGNSKGTVKRTHVSAVVCGLK